MIQKDQETGTFQLCFIKKSQYRFFNHIFTENPPFDFGYQWKNGYSEKKSLSLFG